MKIFVLNPGSSSLKFGLYELGIEETVLLSGVVERIGTPQATLRLTYPRQTEQPLAVSDLKQAAQAACSILTSIVGQNVEVDAFACRVVHGGAHFLTPTLVTSDTLHALSALDDLAPLHNLAAVEVMETVRQSYPNVPLIAVFDTAFHQTLPEVAFTYALPIEFATHHGLRRYGFHGISHRYVSERLLELMNRPAEGSCLIVCHLGNGASICALRDGKSVETSMGMTPLEGLVMGTRSGDLDPGLVLHLLRISGLSLDEVTHLLNHESGLLGVSGVSSDVRELEQAELGGNKRAELALELFAYRVCKYIGAYSAVLEGLDALAFTGGIGEHSASLRSRICRRLKFLGIELNDERNRESSTKKEILVSKEGNPILLWVIPTEEEIQIAREAQTLVPPHF